MSFPSPLVTHAASALIFCAVIAGCDTPPKRVGDGVLESHDSGGNALNRAATRSVSISFPVVDGGRDGETIFTLQNPPTRWMGLELVVHGQHALAEIENAGVIITATLRDSNGIVRAEGTGPLDRALDHSDGTWASVGFQNDNFVFCVAGDQGRVQLNPDVNYTLTVRVKSSRQLGSRIEVLPRLYSANFFGT